MKTVTKHAWTNNPKAQVQLAKQGSSAFSHPDELPLKVGVVRNGWFGRRVVVTTTEPVWFLDAVGRIEIPAAFNCDLASVPRWLWLIVSPFDLALEGLFHDQGYREQKLTRRYVDFLMLHMMELRKVPVWVRYPVWLAVRMFGGKAWKINARRLARAKRKSYGEPD